MIGCDIVDIARIRKMVDRNGDHFTHKIFSSTEIKYAESSQSLKYQRYAARFAAKEAVVKAFRTGFRDITWNDIEIHKGSLGEPQVVLSDKAKKYCTDNGIYEVHISLSHTHEYAMATAYLEK